jgi:hypothetical protein
MDERQTTDLVLPQSGDRVVVYSKMTNYEWRQLKKTAMDEINLNINTKDKTMQMPDQIAYRVGQQVDIEDLAVKFLLKEAYRPDGTKYDLDMSYYFNSIMSPQDGDWLVEQLNGLSGASELTPEAKKK